MKVRVVRHATSFLDVAGHFLAQREAENTVLLGAALRCQRKPQRDAVMLVVQDGAAVALVAIMTPPHALALSAGDPEAVP